MRDSFRDSWQKMPNTWTCATIGGVIGLLVVFDLVWVALALIFFIGIGAIIGLQLDGRLDVYALVERIRSPRGGRG